MLFPKTPPRLWDVEHGDCTGTYSLRIVSTAILSEWGEYQKFIITRRTVFQTNTAAFTVDFDSSVVSQGQHQAELNVLQRLRRKRHEGKMSVFCRCNQQNHPLTTRDHASGKLARNKRHWLSISASRINYWYRWNDQYIRSRKLTRSLQRESAREICFRVAYHVQYVTCH